MQHEKKNRPFFKSPLFLVLTLVLTVLLTAAVGTTAWIRYDRSQQTVTLVHVSDHYLLGPDGSNTGALNLGSIDVSNPGSKSYAFGVKSFQQSYRFQLAYTTNIPFSYSIHRAKTVQDSTYANRHQEDGVTLFYTDNAVSGDFLNRPGDRVADGTKHSTTFGEYSSDYVQKYAEPVYWQSSSVDKGDTIDYYVLKVTWTEGLPNNKETDLIYLTVGAPVGGGQ